MKYAAPHAEPTSDTRNRRRIVGFVGNCQAELLQKAFARMAPAEEFVSFYHFFDMPEERRAAAAADLTRCDALMMQDIQDVDAYPLREAILSSTNVVQFPFLRFASPWPYDDFNGLRDSVARAQDHPSLHTVTYYDGLLGRLRRQVPEPEARLAAYKAYNMPGMLDPARVHDFETRRLEALDARFGLHIGRFILDNFRRQPLFYTVNRPCGALLGMILDYLFTTLDINRVANAGAQLDELRTIQVPVHPFVAERLSVAWADATRRYPSGDREMTWEDFVRAYIRRYG